MRKIWIIGLLALLSLFGNQDQALAFDAPSVRQVEYLPLKIETSPTFREGDEVTLKIKELFPHSCYRSGPAEVRVNGNDIFLRDTAFLYEGRMCLATLYLHSKTVDLGSLPKGDYRIFVSNAGTLKEETRISVQNPN